MIRPTAFLLARINHDTGTIIDARIYSERHPSQAFGGFSFAELKIGHGKDFAEGKASLIQDLKKTPIMWAWLRKFYKS